MAAATATATAASRRDNPKRCLSSCLPGSPSPAWLSVLPACLSIYVIIMIMLVRPSGLHACGLVGLRRKFLVAAHCVYATCACVPSETFCRPAKLLLAIIKTNKLCACCTLRELSRGNWLSGCVSSLIGQRQRSSSIYANNIKLLNSFLCLTKYLAYFVLNLFACLKQLAAAHPPHTNTHSRTHTHTHGLAVNALINVFWRGGPKSQNSQMSSPAKSQSQNQSQKAFA